MSLTIKYTVNNFILTYQNVSYHAASYQIIMRYVFPSQTSFLHQSVLLTFYCKNKSNLIFKKYFKIHRKEKKINLIIQKCTVNTMLYNFTAQNMNFSEKKIKKKSFVVVNKTFIAKSFMR